MRKFKAIILALIIGCSGTGVFAQSVSFKQDYHVIDISDLIQTVLNAIEHVQDGLEQMKPIIWDSVCGQITCNQSNEWLNKNGKYITGGIKNEKT